MGSCKEWCSVVWGGVVRKRRAVSVVWFGVVWCGWRRVVWYGGCVVSRVVWGGKELE